MATDGSGRRRPIADQQPVGVQRLSIALTPCGEKQVTHPSSPFTSVQPVFFLSSNDGQKTPPLLPDPRRQNEPVRYNRPRRCYLGPHLCKDPCMNTHAKEADTSSSKSNKDPSRQVLRPVEHAPRLEIHVGNPELAPTERATRGSLGEAVDDATQGPLGRVQRRRGLSSDLFDRPPSAPKAFEGE
ncbi:hypothetical protein MRX96_046712 [Rhipicephalus microplus]